MEHLICRCRESIRALYHIYLVVECLLLDVGVNQVYLNKLTSQWVTRLVLVSSTMERWRLCLVQFTNQTPGGGVGRSSNGWQQYPWKGFRSQWMLEFCPGSSVMNMNWKHFKQCQTSPCFKLAWLVRSHATLLKLHENNGSTHPAMWLWSAGVSCHDVPGILWAVLYDQV